MVICPDCGKEVPKAKFCKNCGARLPEVEEVEPVFEEVKSIDIEEATQSVEVEEEESVPEEIDVNPKSAEETEEDSASDDIRNEYKIKFCRNCGFKLEGNFKFCPNCGYDLEQSTVADSTTKVVTPTKEKNIILSIILSVIFPGLGQIYLGLDRKGAMFLIGYVVSFFLILLFVGIIFMFVIWIWALVDTIQSTNALNRGESVEDKLF